MRPMHALPIVLVAAALAGCGGDGGDDDGSGGPGTVTGPPPATQTQTTRTSPAEGPDGAAVYESAGCGSCHTLAAANSSGNVGPNLDDLQADFASVRSQVENGGGGMPAFGGDLSSEEIDAVSRFVADNAGR